MAVPTSRRRLVVMRTITFLMLTYANIVSMHPEGFLVTDAISNMIKRQSSDVIRHVGGGVLL